MFNYPQCHRGIFVGFQELKLGCKIKHFPRLDQNYSKISLGGLDYFFDSHHFYFL